MLTTRQMFFLLLGLPLFGFWVFLSKLAFGYGRGLGVAFIQGMGISGPAWYFLSAGVAFLTLEVVVTAFIALLTVMLWLAICFFIEKENLPAKQGDAYNVLKTIRQKPEE